MKYFIGFVLLITITGCHQTNVISHFKDYQLRLARILETQPPEPVDISRITLPAKKHLLTALPAFSVSMREFYGLEGCSIKPIIAKRNTSVGKLQSQSQRLLYELELLRALEFCQKTLSNKPLIATVLTAKRAQFATNWSNLITQSDEIRAFLTAPRGPISDTSTTQLNQVTNALNGLLSITSDADPSELNLEQQLQILADNPLVSQLHYSSQYLASSLTATTNWLQQTKNVLNCESNRPNKTKLNYLQNVFTKYFVKQVQPVTSNINQYHYQLSPLIKQLADHKDLPALQKRFFNQYLQNFADYQTAMSQHIQEWQQLYQSCQIRPGKTSTSI